MAAGARLDRALAAAAGAVAGAAVAGAALAAPAAGAVLRHSAMKAFLASPFVWFAACFAFHSALHSFELFCCAEAGGASVKMPITLATMIALNPYRRIPTSRFCQS
jgi:hypothetical protein